MSTARQRRIAEYMLSKLSPGEIQAGTRHAIPTKPHEEVVFKQTRSAGTRIPASTISRIQTGVFKMGEKTIQKLNNMYRSYAYNRLRESGFNKESAEKLHRKPPEILDQKIKEYHRAAGNIVRHSDATMDAVLASMADSDWDVEDFITQYGG